MMALEAFRGNGHGAAASAAEGVETGAGGCVQTPPPQCGVGGRRQGPPGGPPGNVLCRRLLLGETGRKDEAGWANTK